MCICRIVGGVHSYGEERSVCVVGMGSDKCVCIYFHVCILFVVWCSVVQCIAMCCISLQRVASHCNTLQHTATALVKSLFEKSHCNTLHHTAPHLRRLHSNMGWLWLVGSIKL